MLAAALMAIAFAPAAVAATPDRGEVSLAKPSVAWSGTAAGYGVVVANSLAARTCEAPACDEFVLKVAQAGDLLVRATARGASGFTQLDVVRPDGTTLSNDGAAGQPTSELRLKRVSAGEYLVRTHTNASAAADASYAASARLSPTASGEPTPPPLSQGEGEGSAKDATVIAVIDSSFNPYHWDFSAERMPQATNSDPHDNLPLDRPASEWLPGYSGAPLTRFDLTLERRDAATSMDGLRAEDAAKWAKFPTSKTGAVRLTWFPRTKFIAAATFTPGGTFIGPNDAHGAGTTSAAAGNLHGTCPECLIVALQYSDAASGEAAIQWALKQPWIDVISNSYGFSTVAATCATTSTAARTPRRSAGPSSAGRPSCSRPATGSRTRSWFPTAPSSPRRKGPTG